MRLIKQSTDSNCLSACLASMLDLPLGVVPQFTLADSKKQLAQAQRWLARIGYTLLEVPVRKNGRGGWKGMAIETPCIVGVQSDNGYGHALLGTVGPLGVKIIFDPAKQPATYKKKEIESILVLVPAITKKTRLEDIRLLRE
jgi:hypothetical protein